MIGVFDHPWLGGLFGDAQAQAIWSPERTLSHMLAFEAAWSRALGAAGLMDSETAEAAARAVEAWSPDLAALREGTARDGLPVPALAAALKSAAGPAAEAIHAGSTSQDVMDTALAMTLARMSDLLDARLAALQAALADLHDRFGGAPLQARTRMQAALPTQAATRIASWSDPLPRHRARLACLRAGTEVMQLGGAAGDRAAFAAEAGAIEAHMARALGLAPAPVWQASRDRIADYAGLLSLIAGSCGKIGQDVALMAQQGLDEIELAGGGGSSAMPHKRNPIRAELLVTLARFAALQLPGLHLALVHEQERSGAAWALEWMTLPPLAVAAARALAVATELAGDVQRLGRPEA